MRPAARTLGLFAVATALVVGGCRAEATGPRTALDCPARSGGLTLASAQPHGRTCIYRGAADSQVVLHLVAIPGAVPEALKPFEDEVWAGRRSAAVNWVKVTPQGEIKVTVDGEPQVVLPKAVYPLVRDDQNDVLVGPLRVEGDPTFAVSQYERPMRLRGQQRPGARPEGMVRGLVHKSAWLPGGYRTFAYEAAGPTAGPMAVVLLRSRASLNELPADVRELVRRNGGV